MGGIAGTCNTNSLTNEFYIHDITANTSFTGTSAGTYGGIIGWFNCRTVPTYVKVNNFAHTSLVGSDKAASNRFGGLFGMIQSDSAAANSFFDIGTVTFNSNNVAYKGGGLIGEYNLDSETAAAGVVRLSGSTHMENAKPAGSDADTGQLIGNRHNVIVYSTGNGNGNGWSFYRYT